MSKPCTAVQHVGHQNHSVLMVRFTLFAQARFNMTRINILAKFDVAARLLANCLRENAIRVVLGASLLAALVMWTRGGRIWNASIKIDLTLMLLALLASLSIMCLRALRWNVILACVGAPLPARRLLIIYGATFFLGAIAPGPFAEVTRVWLTRDNSGGVARATAAVVIDRAFDVIPTLLVVAIFGGSYGLSYLTYDVLAYQLTTGAVAILLSVCVFYPPWSSYISGRISRLIAVRLDASFTGGAPEPDLIPKLRGTALVAVVTLSLLSQILLVLQTFLISLAISANLTPWVAYAVTAIGTVASALPLGLGGREAAIYLVLIRVGLSEQAAASFCIACLFNFLSVVSVSFVAYLMQPLDLTQLKAKIWRRSVARNNI